MSKVIRFPGHTRHKCDDHECFVCVGGLYLCTVCRGAEASLTTHCCGHVMDGDIQDEVQAGRLDFVHRRGWINPHDDSGDDENLLWTGPHEASDDSEEPEPPAGA